MTLTDFMTQNPQSPYPAYEGEPSPRTLGKLKEFGLQADWFQWVTFDACDVIWDGEPIRVVWAGFYPTVGNRAVITNAQQFADAVRKEADAAKERKRIAALPNVASVSLGEASQWLEWGYVLFSTHEYEGSIYCTVVRREYVAPTVVVQRDE
jgi:hypothetical protein